MNDEIQRIISGESEVGYGTNIYTAVSYLRTSEKSRALDKTNKRFKHEETERLKKYIENNDLWIRGIDFEAC
jgi:predicted house-cleaning NTP pyrophosphatase (Maf/HAM1 superfamily)